MKTESDRDSAASLSRRAFVVGAGGAVAASTMGSAAGAEDDQDATLTVAVTAPYVPAVRAVVRSVEDHVGDVPVELQQIAENQANRNGGDPLERVPDGEADVSISGHPVVTNDDASELVRGVAVHGWATLATRDGEWRECLSGSALEASLGADSPVEAWSETDWKSVEALRSETAAEEFVQCVGQTVGDDERTHLVRGTRAHQYARGQGGVGWYDVPSGTVGAPATVRRQGDGLVPLVRLASIHVDPDSDDIDSRDVAALDEFLQAYRRRSPALDDVAFHAERDFDDLLSADLD